MSSSDYENARLRAIGWAQRAGRLARERLGRSIASRKADASVVTDVDHAVQDILLQAIAREFPDDAVITEETQQAPERHARVAAARRCWIIDPIDGTRNYARGAPMFCLSIGLFENGAPVAGVIHNPMTGQFYSAAKGGGAWLDAERLAVPESRPPGGTLIGVPSAGRRPLPAAVHQWIERMVLRNTGSTALHLAFVASGAFDAALAEDCHLWDIAAGVLIATEAGAVVVKPDGSPMLPLSLGAAHDEDTPFVAARRDLIDELLEDLRACAGDHRSIR